MRTALTTLAACLALLPAACSGDAEDDVEAEFVAQVNAICAEYGPKLALIPPPAVLNDEWAATGADLADLLEASVNELRLLGAPENVSDQFGDWLALRTEMTAAMRDVQTAGAALDRPGLESGLARVDAAIAEADPLAEELGFADCSPTGVTTGR